jgi:hypothetical protein
MVRWTTFFPVLRCVHANRVVAEHARQRRIVVRRSPQYVRYPDAFVVVGECVSREVVVERVLAAPEARCDVVGFDPDRDRSEGLAHRRARRFDAALTSIADSGATCRPSTKAGSQSFFPCRLPATTMSSRWRPPCSAGCTASSPQANRRPNRGDSSRGALAGRHGRGVGSRCDRYGTSPRVPGGTGPWSGRRGRCLRNGAPGAEPPKRPGRFPSASLIWRVFLDDVLACGRCSGGCESWPPSPQWRASRESWSTWAYPCPASATSWRRCCSRRSTA